MLWLRLVRLRQRTAWLRHIGKYGGDASRVAIGGHSAGGHLAAMALQTRWAQDYGLPADPFKAAVLVSGLFDLQPLRYSFLQPQIQLDDGVIRRNSPLGWGFERLRLHPGRTTIKPSPSAEES